MFGARHRLPVTAVMLFNDAPGMSVLVANRAKNEIHPAADFPGRRIARGAGYGTKAALTDFLLTRAGVPAANYTAVMMGTAGRQEAVVAGLREGAVDVMTFQEPITSALLATKLATPLYDLTTHEATAQVLGAPFAAQCLLMSPRFIAENPATVQRLVDALVRTMRYINSHTADEIFARLPPRFFEGKDRAAEFRLLRDTQRTYAQRDFSIPPAGAQLVADMIRAARFDDSEEGAWRRTAENAAFDVASLYENKFVRIAMARHPERPRLPETAFVDALPRYAPTEKISRHISLWGHGSFKRDFMGCLIARWIAGFHRTQPHVTFENRMYGTASAIGALYTGAGNIALLGEEISPAAATAFERAKGYPPTGIEVATGSLDVNFFDYAHMIFVHRDNPINALTLAPLDAIFGTERRRGASKNLRTWGDLGLSGEWAAPRITPYGWKVDEDFALFFRTAVLENSHRWNPAVQEFVHATRPDGTQYDHGQRILDALAADRFGIAISNVRYARPEVKPLALAARRADVALLGREAAAAEVKAFEWIYRYRPAPIEIATGSLGVPGRSPALVVFVHRDNPLAQLTLAQLDAAFGNERLRGASVAIRTWGALGLSGEWRDRPIHLYAPDTEEGTGRFFRSAVLNDSRLRAWENLREFSDAKTNAKTSAATDAAAEKTLAALAADPLGLAVAGAAPGDARVKALALAASAVGPFFAPTREHMIMRDYPLARPIFAAVNRPPDQPLDPKVRDFLRYLLSPAGQLEIEREGGYLPLSDALLREQLKKLD